MKNKALVVLSGGQDSTTCLYWAKECFSEVYALTFDYSQRHRREIEAAGAIAKMAGVASHEVVNLGPILKGASPLTDHGAPLETYSNYQEMDRIIGDRVELTFVPMRNGLFLTIALNRAVVLGCEAVVTGVCQQDNANYPDCRATFIRSVEEMAMQALGRTDVPRILTPLMNCTKVRTVQMAQNLTGCMEALAYSHTAYDGGYPPVSKDHASTLRAQGFLEAGVPDPLVVRAWREGLMSLPETPNYAELRAA